MATQTMNADAGQAMADAGRLVLRLAVGVLMLLHGIGKLQGGIGEVLGMVGKAGLPPALGYLVYVGEVLAPVLMIVGLWTRPAALIAAINMLVAVLLTRPPGRIFALGEFGNWAIELEGLYFFGAIAVALLGAGRFSVGGRDGRWN
ncbi:MAG: DoxX family protein [Betaproteobacteria bacterium]|nr:MAG: DoxX family protein [Betaproteobacteria bacterium]TMH27267.1 MAG: DoxX family protein [Betaproteobacteria bacterium]